MRSSDRALLRGRGLARHAGLALALALAAPPAGAAERGDKAAVPGFVDGTRLAELAGDDAVSVEITLGKSLLKPILRADPELEKLAGGLESIYALVLEIESPSVAEQVVREVREIESRLVARGWERVARVREKDEEVKVLVLVKDEQTYDGLVVLVVDRSEDAAQVVFANIAGKIDLAAIERLGETIDVPGLSDIEIEAPEREEPEEKNR